MIKNIKSTKNIQFPGNFEGSYSNKENLNFSKDEKKNFSNSRPNNNSQINSNVREFGRELSNTNKNINNSEISTFGFYKV